MIISGMRKLDPEYLIPISPYDYQVLTALADRPMYGFGLIEQCRSDSEGIIDMPRGTIYPVLKRLEKFGYITVARHEAGQGSAYPRRIFALTATGRLVFEQETGRLRRAVFLAQTRIIKP
jgi:DNA-binding PadR family transcriptional regulator